MKTAIKLASAALSMALLANDAIAQQEEPNFSDSIPAYDEPAPTAPVVIATEDGLNVDESVQPVSATTMTSLPEFFPRGEGITYGCECQLERLFTGASLLEPYQGTELGGLQWFTGGELRYRFMDEDNRLRPGGPGESQYDLWRLTAFLEGRLNDDVTLHVEGIDASIHQADLPVTGIDENRWDLLQYYVDAKIGDVHDGVLRVKVGRQFLKFGSQHLVSPLAWGNTYRNFEGINLYYRSDTWDIDGFFTRPLNAAAGNIFRPQSFDHPDASRTFSGIYSTYKGLENSVVDFYWLFLNEENENPARIDGERHTIGVRWAGQNVIDDSCGFALRTWDWDLEAAYQVGEDETFGGGVNEEVEAAFFSGSLGHTWNQALWKPTVRGVFWWGSGDDTPGDGENNTVNTLFPLGHAYWGLIDNLNGSNLLDYSPQVVLHPSGRISLLTAFHFFVKDSARDPVFNVAGAPFPAGAPVGGKDICEELDLILTWKANVSAQVQVGYSWFWYGDAISQDVTARDDATQLYVMFTQKF